MIIKTKNIAIITMAAALAACQSEWQKTSGDTATISQQNDGIAFTSAVYPSRTVTRADASLVDKNVTTLAETTEEHDYSVGLFAAYTGQQTWQAMVTAHNADNTKPLPKANLLFNQKATIAAPAAGKNALTYSPLVFWPNTVVDGESHQEYVSFWGYYPYNTTSNYGEHGIALIPDNMTDGMGKIKYTMPEDTREQSDFLISSLVNDLNKTTNPLTSEGNPKPVDLKFYHMLAQVRIYTVIDVYDRINYITTGTDGEGNPIYRTVTQAEADASRQITDEYGATRAAVLGEKIPDDTEWAYEGDPVQEPATLSQAKTQRWSRQNNGAEPPVIVNDPVTSHPLADVTYTVAFNNIRTSALFTPSFDGSSTSFAYHNAKDDAEYAASANGSAVVSDYTVNYANWFQTNASKRTILDDTYMFGDDNYARNNIILAVPQVMEDIDVPNITVTLTDKTNTDSNGNKLTAKVTVNLLGMNIEWRSGFIYSYAYLDELRPGDDKVRGPESILVVFDPDKHTDQW